MKVLNLDIQFDFDLHQKMAIPFGMTIFV